MRLFIVTVLIFILCLMMVFALLMYDMKKQLRDMHEHELMMKK